MRIRQRVYQEGFDTPKDGKQREAALSDGTIGLLQTWSAVSRSILPDAFHGMSDRQQKRQAVKRLEKMVKQARKNVGVTT